MNAEVRYTEDLKSNLAKLMAAEDIQVVHQIVETASFDTHNRILRLPIWKGVSDDLYNMLITHEIGHALYTPEGYGDPKEYPAFAEIPASYINIVEDARIERMVKAKYPGVVRAFLNGYKEIMNMPAFKISDVNKLNLIDRINLFYKGGMMMGIQFTEEERVFLDKTGKCETFDEVIELSREIYEFTKDSKEDEKMENPDMPSMPSDGDTEEDEDDLYEKPSMGDMPMPSEPENEEDSEESEGENGEGEESGESEDDSDNSEESEEESEGKGDTDADGESDEDSTEEENDQVGSGKEDHGSDERSGEINPQDLESLTDEMFNNTISEIETERNERNVPKIARFPKFNLDDYIVPAKITNKIIDNFYAPRETVSRYEPDYSKYKADIIANMDAYVADNRKVVNYLAKEFEMKKAAYAHRNASISKTGKLNIGKIAKYQVNDDIFLRKKTVKNAKSHGLILLVDWSGSMSNCIKDAIHQTVNTVMFAKRVGIPFEVYSFGAQGSTFAAERYQADAWGIPTVTHEGYNRTPQTAKEGELDLGCEKLRQYITSDMNQTEYKNALANLLLLADRLGARDYGSYGTYPEAESLGGTPLNSNLLKMGKVIERFKAKNNVQKVNLAIMTDGASSKMDGVFTTYDSGNTYSVSQYRYTIKDGYASYDIDSTENITETNSLIEMLRKKYDINVIGFYIAATTQDLKYAVANYIQEDESENSTWRRRYLNPYIWAEKRKEYNKNKFLEATVSGFTKYFIIPGKRNTEVKELDQNMTKAQMKTAFVKNLNKNTESRVVLSKFVELIA